MPHRSASAWRLAATCLAASTMLLLAASSSGLAGLAVPRRVLLQPQPVKLPQPGDGSSRLHSSAAVAEALQRLGKQQHSGRVGGATVPVAPAADAYRHTSQRCRAPDTSTPPLPQLKRAAAWEGAAPDKDGNVTVITSLHVDQLALLEVHCAVWPHKIMAAVYAPVASSGHVACPSQPSTAAQEPHGIAAWMGWLGLGGSSAGSDCPHAGWPLEKLKQSVRETQQRAQKMGLCNLQLELYTEVVTEELGPAAALLPQASLQNKALLALQPEAASEHAAVVLMDGDMVPVDVWQLANWPSRWERAVNEMQAGKVLVLPGFQLSPAGAAQALENAPNKGVDADVAVMQAAIDIVTAEAGKFPLMQMFAQGAAQPLQDRGFGGSQAAAVPELWFEAGDMHGDADDGYPVLPQPGFAPFVFMLQRHVPWADERLRGTYYQRAWQALASRAAGLQHVVQPNCFALQLPHPEAYSRSEAALGVFKQMEPVFRQLAEEVGSGDYVPVISFADKCKQQKQPKKQRAEEEED